MISKRKTCYIVKQEKGNEEVYEIKKFIEDLIKDKAIRNDSKQDFLDHPEDLAFLLNAEEKRFGRKYKIKYK